MDEAQPRTFIASILQSLKGANMTNELEDLIRGLNWLAQGGREHARQLWAKREELENVEEANAWLDDIEQGKEP